MAGRLFEGAPVGRADAEHQVICGLLVLWPLQVLGTTTTQANLHGTVALDDALHVLATRANDASAHLESVVLFDAHLHSAEVLASSGPCSALLLSTLAFGRGSSSLVSRFVGGRSCADVARLFHRASRAAIALGLQELLRLAWRNRQWAGSCRPWFTLLPQLLFNLLLWLHSRLLRREGAGRGGGWLALTKLRPDLAELLVGLTKSMLLDEVVSSVTDVLEVGQVHLRQAQHFVGRGLSAHVAILPA
mmetsp:Transcript_132178/g.313356  ORF Transcript_132178/g.313356 Transcript_132178/m.313356 type:complete len:247 (+) Transcript_132178:225-965(+)